MIVNILKTLSDVNRMRVLNLLKDGELCVCEIEYIMEVNQSNLSRHLKNMTQVGLITPYRKNKYVYYSINSDFLEENPFVKEIISRFDEEDIFISDSKKLQEYKNSDITCDCISQLNLERKLRVK